MKPMIEDITILGGGTAGWLAALYLQRAIPHHLNITLIESSDVPPVGVGESTIPTLVETMKFLGINEKEFLRQTQGTFKAGIKFVNWAYPETHQGRNDWFHPFFPRGKDLVSPYSNPFFPQIGQGFSLSHFWLDAFRKKEINIDFDYACFLAPHVCDHYKNPKSECSESGIGRYAYHIDAGELATYLKRIGISRGIKHKIGHVTNVTLQENGDIDALVFKDSSKIKSDFYIDCTGFASVLLGKTLKEDFQSDSPSLFCNAAVAMPSKNDPEKQSKKIRSYTTSTATKFGWIWEVPLYGRNGNGLVYSKDHLNSDEAEKLLRDFLGESAAQSEAHHIPSMRVGKYKNLWAKNCLAIGLAGSFLEPLEATSILFTELQLATFVNLFPSKESGSHRAKKYNEVMQRFYEEIRDFIILHYYLSKREDSPFWVDVREKTYLPDSLKAKLEMHKEHFGILDSLEFNIFTAQSYHLLFAGMNYLPEGNLPILEHIDFNKKGKGELKMRYERNLEILRALPNHTDYLRNEIFN